MLGLRTTTDTGRWALQPNFSEARPRTSLSTRLWSIDGDLENYQSWVRLVYILRILMANLGLCRTRGSFTPNYRKDCLFFFFMTNLKCFNIIRSFHLLHFFSIKKAPTSQLKWVTLFFSTCHLYFSSPNDFMKTWFKESYCTGLRIIFNKCYAYDWRIVPVAMGGMRDRLCFGVRGTRFTVEPSNVRCASLL